jgi:hypothetical protein
VYSFVPFFFPSEQQVLLDELASVLSVITTQSNPRLFLCSRLFCFASEQHALLDELAPVLSAITTQSNPRLFFFPSVFSLISGSSWMSRHCAQCDYHTE